MSLDREIQKRSNGNCEICTASAELNVFVVAPKDGTNISECVHICATCKDQMEETTPLDANHWRCLNDAMWSEIDAVKVVAYRMLHLLKGEGWPADLIEMFYMDEDTMEWAKATMEDEDAVKHVDCNGIVLKSGDSVVLIKDLDVKGTSMVAKRGTAVRNITLVHDNPEHIEGKVNDQRIVILTQYVQKNK